MRKPTWVIPIWQKITERGPQKLYSVLQSLIPVQGKEKGRHEEGATNLLYKYILVSDFC